jgi:integrase
VAAQRERGSKSKCLDGRTAKIAGSGCDLLDARARDMLGVPLSPHKLRHTCANYCSWPAPSLETIQRHLEHQDVATHDDPPAHPAGSARTMRSGRDARIEQLRRPASHDTADG